MTPAGFPLGIPGIGELIDGEIQQAAQLARQPARLLTSCSNSMNTLILFSFSTELSTVRFVAVRQLLISIG